MCNIHIQESKWLVFATPSCVLYFYTELKKGLSLRKLESLKGEGKGRKMDSLLCGPLSLSGFTREPCSDMIHLGIILFKKNGAVICEPK